MRKQHVAETHSKSHVNVWMFECVPSIGVSRLPRLDRLTRNDVRRGTDRPDNEQTSRREPWHGTAVKTDS